MTVHAISSSESYPLADMNAMKFVYVLLIGLPPMGEGAQHAKRDLHLL
jgi:hypothetical protein